MRLKSSKIFEDFSHTLISGYFLATQNQAGKKSYSNGVYKMNHRFERFLMLKSQLHPIEIFKDHSHALTLGYSSAAQK